MSADIIALPGVTVTANGEPVEPHSCVVEELTAMLDLAKAGELRSFVLIGETFNGDPIETKILCESNLHVINSMLALAQESIKGMLMSNAEKYEAPPLES